MRQTQFNTDKSQHDSGMSRDESGSFRRAPPKLKRIYSKVQKKKNQMIFSHVPSFCHTGG